MKNIKKMFAAVMLPAVLLLTGCSSDFVVTQSGNNSTIEMKNVEDGKNMETEDFHVGSGEVVEVSANMSKGELQIDFAEATTIYGNTNETYLGEVVKSITVSTKFTAQVTLPEGDYGMILTTVGTSNGVVTVKVVKP